MYAALKTGLQKSEMVITEDSRLVDFRAHWIRGIFKLLLRKGASPPPTPETVPAMEKDILQIYLFFPL